MATREELEELRRRLGLIQPGELPQQEDPLADLRARVGVAEQLLGPQDVQQPVQQTPQQPELFGQKGQVGLPGFREAPTEPSPVERGAGFGLEKTAAGLESLLRSGVSTVPGVDVSSQFEQARQRRNDEVSASLATLSPEARGDFEAGQLGGEFLGFAAAPARTFAQRVIGGTLFGAGAPVKGDDPSLLSTERIHNAATGFSLALGGEAIVKAGKGVAALTNKARQAIGFGEGFKEDALEGITGALTKKAREAADRIGTWVTPGEAAQRELTQITEGRIPLTKSVQDEVQGRLVQREEAIAGAINKAVADIVPEGDVVLANRVSKLYKNAYRTEVPLDLSEDLLTDPVLKSALAKVEKSAAGQREFQTLPEGSLGRWDVVKRQLDARITQIGKTGKKTNELRQLTEARNDLVETLDDLNPNYRTARKFAQKGIIKNQIIKKLEAVKGVAGGLEPGRAVQGVTVDQFYNTILKSTKDREQIIRDLGGGKKVRQRVEDLATLLQSINSSKVRGLLKTEDNVRVRTGGFGVAGLLTLNAGALARGNYNRQLAEFITSDKWTGALGGIRNNTNPTQRAEALAAVMARISQSQLQEEDLEEERRRQDFRNRLNQL